MTRGIKRRNEEATKTKNNNKNLKVKSRERQGSGRAGNLRGTEICVPYTLLLTPVQATFDLILKPG